LKPKKQTSEKTHSLKRAISRREEKERQGFVSASEIKGVGVRERERERWWAQEQEIGAKRQ